MEPFGKCSSFLLLMTSMPHFSIPGIPRRIPSVSFATTAVTLIGFPMYSVFNLTSPTMDMLVSPSPSVAVLMFVGCRVNPRLCTRSAFTMHSAVQPVSHVRSSLFETPVLLFVISTGKAGDGLTFTLRLAAPVVSSLHVQPQLQSILAHLIFTDFIEILDSLRLSSCKLS